MIGCLVAGVACGRSVDRSSTARHDAGDSLLAKGDSLFARESYDSARTVYGAALEEARARHDQDLEARTLTSSALAAYVLGTPDKARASAEQSLVLQRAGPPTRNLGRTYNVLGLIAFDEGRLAESARFYERAIEVARATNDSDVVMRASGNLGRIALNLGDMTRAREAQRDSRRVARALGDLRVEGNSYVNEANVDIWEGNPRPAIGRLDTARALYDRAGGFARGQHYALTELATAYEETGDLDAAFASLDTALNLAQRLKMKSQEAETLHLLGELHLRVGDYRRAVDYADRAESELRDAGDELYRRAALRVSGEAYLRLGNLTRAHAIVAQALPLDSIAGQRLDQLDDLLLLTEIEFRQNGLAGAEPRLRSALTLADQIGTRESRIDVAVSEAHLADASRNPQRVLRALRGAGPDIAAGDFAAEWETTALAARAFARLNQLDSAALAGRRAVTAVQRVRGELASQTLRSTYVADRADVYSDLALVLLRLGRPDEAFAVADAARSGELLRRLGAARDDAQPGGLPRELLESEHLLRRIDDLVQKLRDSERGTGRERGAAVDSADAALVAQLDRARGEYEALTIRLAQERPRAVALLGTDPARLGEVRASLAEDEALLDYLIAPDRVIIFVATRSGLNVVQHSLDASTLTQRVRLLHQLWGTSTPNWKWGIEAASGLDGALLAPVRDAGWLRGVRHLIIVPQGILAQVPYPALIDAKTRRYLVQDFTVTVLPSAAALPTLRRDGGAPSQWARNGVAFAPFPDSLPATREEAVAFRVLYRDATLRLGDRATEAELRRTLTLGVPVHIATHAVINARNPMFSHIELSRVASPRPQDDGRLEVHELLGLTVRSPLVFLSGCETGASPEWMDDAVRGTAELTLAQAFLSAGAANVILTLWRIDDAGAGEFAKAFYAGLPRLPITDALAEAQRRMAANARYASPFFWAGYVLAGSGGARSE
jgi:CHAT domain-containing protein